MKAYRRKQVTIFSVVTILSVIMMLSACGGGSSTDAEYVQRAKEFLDKGDINSSIIELKNALQQYPENPEARWLLGLNYVELGNGADAEKELRRAQDLGIAPESVAVPLAKALLFQNKQDELLQALIVLPNMTDDKQAELHSLRGRAYLINGKLDEAGAEFQSALDVKADSTAAMVGQALFAIANQQWDTARSWVTKALDMESTSAEAWSLMGDLEQTAGDAAKAEEAYTKAIDNRLNNFQERLKRVFVRIELERYEDAEKDLTVVKQIAARHTTVLYAQGLLHYKQQRFADAQVAFEQTLNSNANHAAALYYLGLSHYQQDHLHQAEQYLSRFLSEYPQASNVARLLARVHMRTRNLKGAENILQPLVEGNPEDATAANLIGNLNLMRGNTNEGIQYLQKAVRLRPDDAETRIQFGLGLLQQGEKDQGLYEMETAIELDPEHQEAELALINAYIRRGELDNAMKAATQLVKKRPNDPGARNILGVANMLKDENEQARHEFKQALTLEPNFRTAEMNLAKLDYKEGNKEAAAARFRQILEQDESHLEAMVLLADLADQAGRSDEAIDWLERAWEKNPDSLETGVALVQRYLDRDRNLQALNVARNLHSLYPEDWRALRIYGLAQMANGEIAGAVFNFRRLTELQPQSAENWHLLAAAQTRSKDYQNAIESLDKALDVQNDYLPSLRGKIELQLRVGRLDEALEGARTFQAQFPSHSIGYKLEGDVYTLQKEFAKAVTAYQAAYEKSPSSELVLMLSNTQRLAGDNEAALNILEAWLAAHPQDTQFRTQHMRQLRLIAVVYMQQKDLDKALEIALRLQEIHPDNPHGFSLAGGIYALQDETAKAKAALNKALAISPGDVDASSNLAAITLLEGDQDEARRLYEEALVHRPGHLNILLKLAKLESQAGRPEQARARLEEAVETHPDTLQPRILLAKNHLAAGRPQETLTLTKPLLSRYPNEPALLEVTGKAALLSGDAVSAAVFFKRLITVLPDSAAAHFSYAESLAQAGELDRARQELARALELDPSYLPARIGEIKILAQLNGDWQGASEALTKMKQEFGERPEVLGAEGWLALLNSDYQTAAKRLSQALAKGPDHELTVLLVSALWAQDKHAQALEVMQEWLAGHPQDLAVLLQLASGYLTMGREEEARAVYARVVEFYPNHAPALNNLAWLTQDQDLKQAVAYAERAHELLPNDPQITDTLGNLLMRRGEDWRGYELIREAAERAPENAEIQLNLGRALVKQRKFPEARQVLSALIAKNPESSSSEEASALLESIYKN